MSRRQREELFNDFVQWGFDTRGWAQTTRQKYRIRVRAADRWLTENRNTSIFWAKPQDLKAFLFSRSPNATTRNNVRQILVAFGAFLVDIEMAEVNHALGLPRLPQQTKLPRFLNADQAYRVVKAAKVRGLIYETLVVLMLFQGLRHNEARVLEWRYVDLDNAFVRFTAKGSKERVLPLHPKALKALTQWRSECEDPQWVFPSTYGGRRRPVSHSWLKYHVRAIGKDAGIKGLHPHTLRHTFATNMMQEGGDIREVQEALGHASPSTTAIYTHVLPTRLRDAINRVNYDRPKDSPAAKEQEILASEDDTAFWDQLPDAPEPEPLTEDVALVVEQLLDPSESPRIKKLKAELAKAEAEEAKTKKEDAS